LKQSHTETTAQGRTHGHALSHLTPNPFLVELSRQSGNLTPAGIVRGGKQRCLVVPEEAVTATDDLEIPFPLNDDGTPSEAGKDGSAVKESLPSASKPSSSSPTLGVGTGDALFGDQQAATSIAGADKFVTIGFNF
jgi:hypothetical protein